jgi:hypothetical protein
MGLNVRFALWLFELLLKIILALVDLVDCLGVEPGDSLAVLPETILYFTLARIFVNTKTVLLAVVPPAFILPAVCPEVKTITCLLVFFVLAFIGHSVSVDIDAHAVHVVVVPVAVVLAAILPLVLAYSVDAVIEPVSLVN